MKKIQNYYLRQWMFFQIWMPDCVEIRILSIISDKTGFAVLKISYSRGTI